MYGGAAAASYINQPNIKQQSVAVVNESINNSNDDSTMSSSSRRIMELLESYSSPLMEARRIPLYSKPKNAGFKTSAHGLSPYTNKTICKYTFDFTVVILLVDVKVNWCSIHLITCDG